MTLPSRLVKSFKFCSIINPNFLKLGDTFKQTRVFSMPHLLDYSKVSLDFNPLHFDADCALTAGFQHPIVHGMLLASLFPRIISSHFPGAVYLSQNLQFKQPVYIGEEICGEVEAISMRDFKKKHLVKFSTRCFKQDSLLVLDGEAMAILPTLQLE
ncbi:3-hydroxyacyl-[acyl-carrier-protein] dehydratase, mitochondrial-like isoform X1 [Silene latifolia]|uniref:3-hydroxyacyl-[acyl-carrier-protein] dehydratase, mitochondrial-like isoform X1 n=1 Tax=Silene latifolia TaxID=37657 RepID=UPI003D76BA07